MRAIKPFRSSQRGIALITAVLIVALATILAVNVSFRGYLDQRRTATQFILDQGYEVAIGAEGWAADTLQKDMKAAKTVDFTQAWATPLPPIPIEGGEVDGGLEDMQGRLNLNDLVDQTGNTDTKAVERLQALLQLLDIDPRYAQAIADWIDIDTNPEIPDGAEDSVYTSMTPSYLTANMPITRVSEILAVKDMNIEIFHKLEPFVAALPRGTTINVCTAPEEVLDAIVVAAGGGVQFSQAKQNTAASRKQACFPDKQNFLNTNIPAPSRNDVGRILGDTSNYFRASIFVTIGATQFTMYSLLHTSGPGPNTIIRPILRSFGSA
jgi:general secretion pathway protein K